MPSSDPNWWRERLGQQRPLARAPQQAPARNPGIPANGGQPHPQPPTGPPQVTVDNIYQAAAHWKGGKAHQVDRDPCPQCGSGQYFSRSQGAVRGPSPAPHCYNCGYNGGLFDQGDPVTWGAS